MNDNNVREELERAIRVGVGRVASHHLTYEDRYAEAEALKNLVVAYRLLFPEPGNPSHSWPTVLDPGTLR